MASTSAQIPLRALDMTTLLGQAATADPLQASNLSVATVSPSACRAKANQDAVVTLQRTACQRDDRCERSGSCCDQERGQSERDGRRPLLLQQEAQFLLLGIVCRKAAVPQPHLGSALR